MRKLIVQLYRDRRKQWRFRLIAGNGRILASSEAYSSLAMATNGVKAILKAKKVVIVHAN